MDVTLRPLTDADVDAVVAFSLDAWAPVFAGFEQVMGPRAYRFVYPDWRTAQAAAVAEVCRSLDAWVADVDGAPVGFVAVLVTGGDDGHAPARALYERHGFTGLPLVRYYRAL